MQQIEPLHFEEKIQDLEEKIIGLKELSDGDVLDLSSEIENLNIKSEYFLKSFISVGEVTIFGESIPFTTLAPFIDDFNPKNGCKTKTTSRSLS